MENMLNAPDSADQIRAKLANYTASPTIFDDMAKCSARSARARNSPN